MALNSFTIEFNRGDGPYIGGQIVAGKVLVDLTHPIRTSGTTLTLAGHAKNYWCSVSRGKAQVCAQSEEYVSQRVELFGFGEGHEERVLVPGLSEFPFQLQLPPGLPSTFTNGKHGGVTYFVESVLYRSGLDSDDRVKRSLIIQGVLDLNSEPENIRNWTILTKTKDLYRCCFKSGPIRFNLKIPKSGYIPGEDIAFVMELTNSTPFTVDVTLALVQSVKYEAEADIKIETNQMLALMGPTLKPQSRETWKDEVLKIPSDIPITNLGGCKIIQVNYFLKVTMNSLSETTPITIGTIPLNRTEDSCQVETFLK